MILFIDSFDFFDEKFCFFSSRREEFAFSKNLTTNPTSLLVRTDKRFAGAVSAELTRQFGSYVDVRTWGGPTAILEIVSKGIQKQKACKRLLTTCLSIKRRHCLW